MVNQIDLIIYFKIIRMSSLNKKNESDSNDEPIQDIIDSDMGSNHQTKSMVENRNLSFWKLFVNIIKMYTGIQYLSAPYGTARVGIMGSYIGLSLLLLINVFSTYLIIKARNRYKMHDI